MLPSTIMLPCTSCSGGKVPCSFCGGTGKVDDGTPSGSDSGTGDGAMPIPTDAPGNGDNPGYHITTEKTEYTLNLAREKRLRVNFTLSYYRQEQSPGYSFEDGLDGDGNTIVRCVDWTRENTF